MRVIEKVLGETPSKPNIEHWCRLANAFLSSEEARTFIYKLKLFNSLGVEDQIKYVHNQIPYQDWAITSKELHYLAETLEFLAKQEHLLKYN